MLLRSVVAGSGSTTYGPAAKLNLRDERLGLGIGLIGQANVNTDGKLESGALILPVTIPAGSVLRWNTNVGWLYNRSGERDQFFSGSQLEMTVTGELNVMAECFDRNPGKIGAQVRLRWTPRNANYDLDFLYGSYVNGAARHIVTLNLTLRS
ncbi:MAG: hypothetical protein JO208_01015 [Alphaproteobacteria bacterium]|nr:hypothetical protein [Alphaproteobacteria bacterium]